LIEREEEEGEGKSNKEGRGIRDNALSYLLTGGKGGREGELLEKR